MVSGLRAQGGFAAAGIRNPSALAFPNTDVGNQKRREFISNFLTICPATVRLYVPTLSDGASITERSKNAATITAQGTPTYGVQGSAVYGILDGSSQYYTLPDAADLTFGDASLDGPFSLVVMWNQTGSTGEQDLMAKYDITTGSTKREYRLELNAGKLTGNLYDESSGGKIGRSFDTALATATWNLGGMTYDGMGTNAGVSLWAFNGTQSGEVDDTDSSAGSYTAMENTASLLYIGASQGASAIVEYLNGQIALAAVVGSQLLGEHWFALRELANAFLDKSL